MDQEQSIAQNPSPAYPFRSLRHRILGKLLELVITRFDITVQSEFQMMSEPPRGDLLLLRREGKVWSEEQREVLPDGIRDRHARYHLLECKFTESVNESAVQQALGYDIFYLRTQRLKRDELQTYLLSAKKPSKKFLDQLGYHRAEAAGVYVTERLVLRHIVLLVLNELSKESHNDCFRLFASQQRVRKETLEDVNHRHRSDWSEEVWSVVLGLQNFYEMEDTAMFNYEVTVEDVMKMGSKLRKQVIATAKPNELDEKFRKQIIATAKLGDLDETTRKQVISTAKPDDLDETTRKQVISTARPDDLDETTRKQVISTAKPNDLDETTRKQVISTAKPNDLDETTRKQVIASAAVEERLTGISPDEIPALLAQLEAMLDKQPVNQQPIEKPIAKRHRKKKS